MRSDLKELVAPRLLSLHVLGVLATLSGLFLGLWQLEVWQAQREAAARDLTALTPVPIDEVLDADDPFPSAAVGRPVDVTGSWLPAATFYVTDRDHQGRDGVWAVTPVAVCDVPDDCGSSAALLAVRGWAADPGQAPVPPEGTVQLTGWLQPPEGSGRPDPDPGDDVLPEVRVADAIQRVDQDLYGAFLIVDEAEPADAVRGLEPVTPDSLPQPGSSTGLRNLLYAVQWWVFGVFAAFVWWRWVKDELERSRPTPEPEEDDVPEVRSST